VSIAATRTATGNVRITRTTSTTTTTRTTLDKIALGAYFIYEPGSVGSPIFRKLSPATSVMIETGECGLSCYPGEEDRCDIFYIPKNQVESI